MGRSRTSPSASISLLALVGGYLFVDLISAAPESPLTPPLIPGAGPAGWMTRGAAAIGLDRVGRVGLTALALFAIAALLAAFALVLREAWRRRVGVGPVAVAGVAAIALAVAAPLLLSRDAYSYAAYGRIAVVHGDNPYVTPPNAFPDDPFTPITSAQWRDTRSRYGPLFTLMSEGVVRSAPDPAETVFGFKLLAVAGVALAALFAAAAAASNGRAPASFAAAMVVLNPVLVLHTVGGGHNDALVAAALAGAAYLAIRSRPERMSPAAFAVTGVLALAALVKITAGIALLAWIGWLVTRRREDSVRTTAAHAGFALACAAVITLPYYAGRRTLSALASVVDLQGWASPARLVARGAEAAGNVIAASVGDALSTVVYVGFLVLFGWVLIRLIRTQADEIPAVWGMALLVFALAAPYLLPWYAAWFLPLLPLVANRRFLIVGLVAAGVLALTGIPAEPGSDPDLWRGMILAVHYVAAPVMLLLLALALRAVPTGIRRETSTQEGLTDARP